MKWTSLLLVALCGCSTPTIKKAARLAVPPMPPTPAQVMSTRLVKPFVSASAEMPLKRLVATVPVAVTVVTNGRTLNVFVLPANIMPPLSTPKLLRLPPLTALVVTGPHATIIPFTDGPDSYIAAYWDSIPISPKVEIQSGTVGNYVTLYSTPWDGSIDVLNVTRKSNLPVELLRLKVQ